MHFVGWMLAAAEIFDTHVTSLRALYLVDHQQS